MYTVIVGINVYPSSRNFNIFFRFSPARLDAPKRRNLANLAPARRETDSILIASAGLANRFAQDDR
jgi:hypothetical protein